VPGVCQPQNLTLIVSPSNPFETIVLQSDFIADLHAFAVVVDREMRQKETPEAVEHLQGRVGLNTAS